jgi:signal-transduction protein with cAMP-binding, CBS, and nucleotidyltransferase domain
MNMISQAWREALLPIEATLGDAIRSLNDSALQIVLVVSPDEVLVGTVTDGDIRRGLINEYDTKSSIKAIIHREPLVAPPALSREMVLQLMQANQVHQVPIVDGERRVLGLYLWDKILSPNQRSSLMVIMAGGEGKRLRPYTENCPKPMLSVSGKPMLEHIISGAKAEGFNILFWLFAISAI